jgi:soluble cytochrome b562
MHSHTMKLLGVAALGFMLVASPSFGGEMQDFEHALRISYADYRNALFLTNVGKTEESAKAIKAFSLSWSNLARTWLQKPPPQYVDDKKWRSMFADVTTTIDEATTKISANKLPEAHQALETVRNAVGNLHLRNDISTFSDRMNAYHLVMEQILTSDMSTLDAERLQSLHEQAAVLSYLVGDALAHPPPAAKGNAQFDTLSKNMTMSIESLLTGLRANDPVAVKSAVGQLKPAYAKLFLNFG